MTTRLERIVSFVPEFYKPSSNVMFSGILKALAQEDTDIDTSITDAKDQLYISRAVSKYLDFLASNFNVARPTLIKFIDSKFTCKLKKKYSKRVFFDIIRI
jgi:hypothetical protein